jgi:hypothetical protein
VVEPDLRKCVTPLCGGYWVALANHARTVCHDGALRPRCYMTISMLDLGPARLSEGVRSRAEAALATKSGLFVSGRIAATPDGGRALEVSRVYLRGAT